MTMQADDTMLPGSLSVYVIYARSPRYPEHYVVREWRFAGGAIYRARNGSMHRALEDARAELIRRGLDRVGATLDDDPSILEVWR